MVDVVSWVGKELAMTRRANLKLPACFCRHALTRLDTLIDLAERERAAILTRIARVASGRQASQRRHR
jgi:hypothetical protein